MSLMAQCGVCGKELLTPICPLCLTDKIEPWIESKRFSLVKNYREEVRKILDKTKYGKISCKICRGQHEKAICLNCFLSKIYSWLETKNEILAEEFRNYFSAQLRETKLEYA
jgi:hypothetical protein